VRWSHALIPTFKESPADAVAASHVLMLRAGLIRQLGAGAYSYLPLGFRVLNKAIQIIRQEMDAAGALELLLPAVHPVELWEESGRYGNMGGILMELTLGGDRKAVLGPTHEEVVTDIARDLIKSYKQLPLTVYQIQTKFRDEPRPRFGVLRTREFLMKDAYSFGTSLEQLNASYEAMYEAYCRIFDRCGLPYVAVEAESGPIGGESSHEFMVPCDVGEDTVIQCPKCGYAANRERAEIGDAVADAAPLAEPGAAATTRRAPNWWETTDAPVPPPARVETPGRRTIQEVCDFLKADESATAKLLVFLADGKPVAALIRGDHEANEAKVRRAFGARTLEPADAPAIEKATGAPMGFLGPIGIKIPLAVDRSVAEMTAVVVGGNETDVHLTGVVPGRDFPLDNVRDLRNAESGDPCPRCGDAMAVHQGIEVGHVFKLGTKYSQAMGATFLDANGQAQPQIMGCYGIGVNRILASAVETGHDANGIIWPLALAPYEVILVPLQVDNEAVVELTDRIERTLAEAGHDVLVDDRDQRPGVKFKDADLIGIPLRVVIGERGLQSGVVEVKWRTDKDPHEVSAATAAEAILAELESTAKTLAARCEERRVARAASRGHH
jgi:prolyl-tRNA synthetase